MVASFNVIKTVYHDVKLTHKVVTKVVLLDAAL